MVLILMSSITHNVKDLEKAVDTILNKKNVSCQMQWRPPVIHTKTPCQKFKKL